jgi:hypothetical protein
MMSNNIHNYEINKELIPNNKMLILINKFNK